ncbi:MAG: Tad domain-containing protein, partial [Chloroflexi bacterium]|nr:Tad domain-containing protein [Chloroflexota bacterium]
MKDVNKSEFGQAIYIIAIGMVALLGFTALSIDGGRIYLDRRRAQNAADQAVMTSALAKVEGYDWLQRGLDRAAENEFNNDGVTNTVTIYSPPISGFYAADDNYVQVFITTESETSLIQFFYSGETKVTVEAVARIQLF